LTATASLSISAIGATSATGLRDAVRKAWRKRANHVSGDSHAEVTGRFSKLT